MFFADHFAGKFNLQIRHIKLLSSKCKVIPILNFKLTKMDDIFTEAQNLGTLYPTTVQWNFDPRTTPEPLLWPFRQNF